MLLLWACAETDPAPDDADGDGAPAGSDCDDADPAVHPGATERCDGVDDDCDGAVDEGWSSWRDADGDGWGGEAVEGCAGAGQGGDCDDADPAVSPEAREACGGGDEDCDGLVDDADPDVDPSGYEAGWADGDGDGWGGAAVLACAPGGPAQGGDCDDADPGVSPEAAERCDGVDDDCDGAIDESGGSGFVDHDGDGWGAAPGEACAGLVPLDGDCDDGDPATHPDAVEACGGGDEDCDGLVDDADPSVDPAGFASAWTDADGDGWGAELVEACLPDGVSAPGDCDDADAAVSPGAVEACGGGDEDCDGLVDDADPSVDPAGFASAWTDADGDGWGAELIEACLPDGVSAPGDCDDADATVSPAGSEACGGGDEDCDGLVDDADPSVDPAGFASAWTDADGDGWGVELLLACAPAGAAEAGDCDDTAAAVHPEAAEICDDLDDDCDGLVDLDDEDLVGTVLYRDRDGDGIGADAAVRCDPTEAGWSAVPDDCDDSDATLWSGCTEPVFTEHFDVVVVGSGPAGLAAALSARELGASVLLVERKGTAGQGTIAGQGLLAVGTPEQAAEGITDGPAELLAEWEGITGVAPGEGVEDFAEASAELLSWLDSYGVTVDSLESRADMGSVARAHVVDALSDDGGAILVDAFDGELRTRVELTGPVMWGDAVVGVHVTDKSTGTSSSIGASAVVLATGGYQRDEELLASLLPGLSSRDYVFECILEADGGGLPFLDLLGAAYVDLGNVGVYSHAVVDPEGDGREALLWYEAGRGVVVGEDGQRFAAEDGLASLDFYGLWPEGEVYAVLDGDIAETVSLSRPLYNLTGGLDEEVPLLDLLGVSTDVWSAGSLPELAVAAGIDPALEATVEAWNEVVRGTATDALGRDPDEAAELIGPDWYAVRLHPGVAKAFGGVVTDAAARVLDEDGVAIPGLWAAGEVAGMLPGGGSGAGWGGSVAGCYHAGRVAGQEAAIYAGY